MTKKRIVKRWGRASQCTAQPPVANRVTAIATKPLSHFRRTRRKSAAEERQITRVLARTTADSPPLLKSSANMTSHPHSQANHGAPGREKENMSVSGT